jgi:hypothetical protein
MPTKTSKTVFWFDDGKRPNVADSPEKEKDMVLLPGIVSRSASSASSAPESGPRSENSRFGRVFRLP